MNTTMNDISKLYIHQSIAELTRRLGKLLSLEKCLDLNRPSGFIVKDSIDDSEILCSMAVSRKIVELLEAELLEELKDKKLALFEQMKSEQEATQS